LNYRHAFHAGNFADVVKHAALLQMLRSLADARAPLDILDTHAGAGVYDLLGPEAQRSGEAEAGVLRMMAAGDVPAVFDPLIAAVRALNKGGETRLYPGSPVLAARALRPGDRYLACELRPAEHAALRAAMKPYPGVETRCADGYRVAMTQKPAGGRRLVLIDPPFERPDDYRQAATAAAALVRGDPKSAVIVWLPLKDLETFDGFVRDLEGAVRAPVTIAETRIRPLNDPMKMNGCALAVIGAPPDFDATLSSICGWVADGLGKDGQARIWTTS